MRAEPTDGGGARAVEGSAGVGVGGGSGGSGGGVGGDDVGGVEGGSGGGRGYDGGASEEERQASPPSSECRRVLLQGVSCRLRAGEMVAVIVS